MPYELPRLLRTAGLAGAIALATMMTASAGTAPPAGLDDAVREIALHWESIKFAQPEDLRAEMMGALESKAAALAARYPGRAEPMVWDGILLSERAALAGPFSALGFAKKARDVLRKAEQIDPAVLDGGAPTSLGALYHSVPGFPIGFGDDDTARKLLKQAVGVAPQGMDAWFFYGSFLYDKGEYADAADALANVVSAPPHPDRPLWDRNRRNEAKRLLTKIESRS